ncbi:MAG: recombinase family protein, partial [Streptococcaceae bacterium]|jgi:site-specific DNA recombinase|nr:recombinase family protein [Streptococcaceae bacterium]
MIIRDVFETYLAGGTLDGIARKLNAEGHIGKEKLWVPQTVKNVLHNSIYAGYNYHRGERYKGNHAPIITLEMWEKVQEIMKIKQQEAYSKGNTGRPWQSKYMLSGLLRCGICGAALKLFSNQLRTDGTRSISYKCVSTMPKSSLQGYWQAESCNGKSHMREPIESEILEWVEVLRRNPEMIEKNNDNESIENDIKIIEDKIGDIDKKTELLVDLYLDAKIERDIFDKRKGTLNEERESCLTKIDKLKESLKSDDNYKTAKEVLSSIGNPIRTYDEATQKKIVRQLVDHIEVSNDQTKIVWRF